MSIQKGTFNTIAQNSSEIGGHYPVWSRVRELYQGGGFINLNDYSAGDVIQAGTMVKFNGAGKEVEIIAENASDFSVVNGLIFEDVCIPEGCILATCAVVRAGRIYADRVGSNGLPTDIEAQLPMIEFVREG